jgi:hypothetical protein
VGEAGAASVLSPIIVVGMQRRVGRDLPLLRQLDHVHGRQLSPFLHDRHFNAASSFQIGVSGGRIASSGMLALVSQRWRLTGTSRIRR